MSRPTAPRSGPAWAVVLALLGACGGEEAPDSSPPDRAAADTAGEPAGPLTIGAGPVRVMGYAVVDENRRDFQACEGGPEYRLEGPALFDLLELHEGLTPGMEPSEAIFVDVLAEVEPPPERGAGADYAGVVDVLEVRRAAWEGWSCDGPDPDLVVEARGNEPFWNLRVGEAEARFSRPEGERTWEVAGPPAPSPEGWRVGGTTETGVAFTLVLEVGGCRDSMSGAWSHVAATLTAGEDEWRGCAWLGPAVEPL